MTLNYVNYYKIRDGMLICFAPPQNRKGIMTKASYPLQLLVDSGDAIIKKTKMCTVQKIISPIFSEIIIAGINACRGDVS